MVKMTIDKVSTVGMMFWVFLVLLSAVRRVEAEQKAKEKGHGCEIHKITATEETRHIKSPNYPRPYDNAIYQCWKIEASKKNTVIHLSVVDLDLEATTPCESGDYIVIQDGPSNDSEVVRTFCGKKKPLDVITTGQHVFVQFRTNSKGSHKGFNIKFKAIHNNTLPKTCQSLIASETNKTLLSPGYPAAVERDTDMCWNIKPPKEKKFSHIKVMVVDMALVCHSAFVEVRHSHDSKKRSIVRQKWCGFNLIGAVVNSSASNGLNLRLRTHQSNAKKQKGFKIQYYAFNRKQRARNALNLALILPLAIGGALVVCFAVACAIGQTSRRKRRRRQRDEDTENTAATTSIAVTGLGPPPQTLDPSVACPSYEAAIAAKASGKDIALGVHFPGADGKCATPEEYDKQLQQYCSGPPPEYSAVYEAGKSTTEQT